MPMQYMVSQEVNPYVNLAQEAELMSHAEKGMAILFLWQNENTIVVGRNQDVDAECKREEFLDFGGKIARRRSGGGAVYHDLGNLNFSIICKKEDVEKYKYQNIIKKALCSYGLQIDYNGRNDLVFEDRKFSGNAVYDDGHSVCQHGTIMINTSIETMERYLTPDIGKLDRNHVASVSSRVINLAEILKDISVPDMIRRLIDTTRAKIYSYDVFQELKGKYEEMFSSREWIYGGR